MKNDIKLPSEDCKNTVRYTDTYGNIHCNGMIELSTLKGKDCCLECEYYRWKEYDKKKK